LSPVGTKRWLSPLPMTVIACAGTPSRTRASLPAKDQAYSVPVHQWDTLYLCI
jgi:hypothetical protein